MTNKRGSEWRIWDLHIHTPFSIKQKYNNTPEGWEKFINALENLPKDVKVIGITDYYFIDGYEKVMNFKLNGRLNNIEKIFPILEFRIDTFGTASESSLQKINLHILFDVDETKLTEQINKIRTEFIGQIPITKLERHKTKMLTIENLTSESEGDLHTGFANLIPCTEKVFDLINSSEWNGKTFLFLGYKEWSNLEKNQQLKPFKEDLYSKVNAFFSNNSQTNERNQTWLNEYGNKKLLHSLDIHGFDLIDTYEFDESGNYIPCKNYHCHTWIKAEPTFEGLKQIIYEPEQRVKIQNHRPDFKEDKLIIDSVKYISNDNLFNSETIFFNKNLNVIIGGKSSGKSILLYNIAKTLETSNEVTKITSVNDKDKYNFREKDKDFDFEVTTSSGATKRLYDGQNSIITNIKYIPQNYLSKLAEPNENKKGNELLKYVRGLLLESPEHNEKYEEFLYNVRSNDKLRNDIIDNYFKIKEYINEKEKELKELGNEEALKRSIESNTQRIEELKKGLGLTGEQIKDYNSKKEQLETINSDITKTNEDYRRITSFNTEVINSLQELISRKELIEKSINKEEIKNLFNLKFDFIKEKFNELSSFKESLKIEDKKFVHDNLFKTLHSGFSERKNSLNKDLEVYQKNEQIKEETTKIDKTVSDDKITLQKIQKLKEEVILNKQELQKEKEKLFKVYDDNFLEYPKIVEILKERASLSEEDKLIIEGSTKFNASKFNKRMKSISDLRSFPENTYSLFKEREDLITYDSNSHLNQIKELFSSIAEKQDFPLNSENKRIPSNAIKVLLDDYFVDYWETIYDGDKMDKMSTGKASFVILMLIIGLSNSNAPILIDQPEDNLDNRSITKDLVEYLRKKN